MKKHRIMTLKPLTGMHVLAGFVLLHVALCDVALGQSDITNQVRTVIKVAFMGRAVSNELVNISTNESVAADLRQYAANALTNYNAAGTNAYETLESFITGWTITNEPAISSNLITTMSQILEYGASAKAQLSAFVASTNTPAHLQQTAAKMLQNLDGGY